MILSSWSTFFDASGIAGLVALIWQAIDKFISFRRRPQLRFLPFDRQRDLRTWETGQPNAPKRKFFTLEVVNTGKRAAVRCVATLRIEKFPPNFKSDDPRFALHWASAPVDDRTSGTHPVDIGSEGNRLDVVFTIENQSVAGSWVATPLAMVMPVQHQAYLPTGSYEGVVEVKCDNGAGQTLRVRIYSPSNWLDLDASPLN